MISKNDLQYKSCLYEYRNYIMCFSANMNLYFTLKDVWNGSR